jgi:hypothetical protein
MKSWSYSAIKAFETCPRQYHAVRVEKLYPYVESSEASAGVYVHKLAEDYVRDGTPLPDGFQKLANVLDVFRRKEAVKLCEQKIALREDKTPCSFFDKKAWVRGIVDLLMLKPPVAWVVDYKTGKSKYADTDQLQLMALLVFELYPDITSVHGGLLFLPERVLIKRQYDIKDRDALWEKWTQRVSQVDLAQELDTWKPKPSGLCRKHCPVSHCEFYGG